jgi:hypothetical protein
MAAGSMVLIHSENLEKVHKLLDKLEEINDEGEDYPLTVEEHLNSIRELLVPATDER